MIAQALGWLVLAGAALALMVTVGRRAVAHGIIVPVVVGLILRVVVMVIAHAGSVSLGDHGIFFLDDETYRHGAVVLSDLWRGGHTPDPSRYNVLGTYQYGYQLYLAAIFTLGTSSVLLGKLWNVLLGSATVYLVGRLGGQLLGERAKVRAAWIAALAPGMVWWSATLMKETFATWLLALGLLAVTALPRPKAVAVLAAVLVALTVARGPSALALIVGAGVALAVAGRQAEGRWLSRPLIAFATTLAVGFVAVVAIVSRGNLHSFFMQYDQVVRNMFEAYGGGDITRAPYNAVKSLVTPLPWVFDSNTYNWDRMLYPDVWLLFCALPLAGLGAWRLRRRPEAWAILATIAVALVLNSVTGGFTFRQRSMLEPLILLLALAGVRSWRMAARTAAAALGLVAVIAAVQSRSPLTAVLIASAAGAMLLLSRRLGERMYDPLPGSPMVASVRASLRSAPPSGATTSNRVLAEVKRTLRLALVGFRTARAAVVRLAPPLRAAPTPVTERKDGE
ncbi:MAG: hypothetical protein QOE60_1223 [Thermoleophilaceae bacterium]|nr:hypothetical protein [Thermoleophilaceae bacterium]